jgi:hypothetical protein
MNRLLNWFESKVDSAILDECSQHLYRTELALLSRTGIAELFMERFYDVVTLIPGLEDEPRHSFFESPSALTAYFVMMQSAKRSDLADIMMKNSAMVARSDLIASVALAHMGLWMKLVELREGSGKHSARAQSILYQFQTQMGNILSIRNSGGHHP